jgi:3-phenylpropionate/cinnamic acid dioxygenase small subunit
LKYKKEVVQLNYQLLIKQNGTVYTYYIQSDYDLLEKYKEALLMGNGLIVWDKGVIDCSQIVGIIKD